MTDEQKALVWALIERQTGLERRHLDENEQWLCETSFRAGQAAQTAENERLREAKWIVRHADTANDMVLIGMARDSAIAERDAARDENARLREALRDIAKYDVGLQNLIDDNVYEETETSRYYAMNISWRQKLARKALDGETE
jgi:hypothetical protein